MSRIARVTQKIFASLASNNGVFGSAQNGTKIDSNDLPTLMSLPAYLQGWLDATLGGSKFPTLEEMQALSYIEQTQIAYIFQEGIAAYDSATTYYTNSIVKQAGSFLIYGSLTNDNLGNSLSDPTNWQLLGDLSQLASNVFTGGTTTGAANAQVLASLVPASGFSLSKNGQTIICTAGFTNTGAATLAITSPSITATAIKKDSPGGLTPLTGGEIVAGDTIYLSVNTAGSCLVLTSGLALGTAASKAASDVTKAYLASVNGATTIGNIAKFVDVLGTVADSGIPLNAIPRGWANIAANGTINAGVGASSCTNSSAGVYVINTSATLPANIAVQVTNANGSTISGSNGSYTQELSSARTTNSFTVRIAMSGSLANPDQFNVEWSY